ncbi:MAG TPA: phosphoribosylanthranilate isomerase, partial [Acidimicrobiales bacterium]|nr:phosphoribosylanthranilate isomerase [Acidimicrobiales bacterium]
MFVKICGTTSEEDALLAVAMGAEALGFVFAPSPRQMRPQDVTDILKRLPPEILTVGVFKDDLPERIVHIVRATGLKGAQIHGSFSVEDAVSVRRAIFHTFVAFSALDPRVEQAHAYEPYAVLLDGARSGAGQTFDWSLADRTPEGLKLIVAGGLTSDNVVEVIRTVRPWGVDVVSGVESSPGRKDPVKLRAFIAKAHAAGKELRQTPEPEAVPRDKRGG